MKSKDTSANQPVRIVAGFGRSGTTWVQDVLAEANRLRPVFEPLHPELIPGASRYAHRFLEAGDVEEDLYKLLRRFFLDDFTSLWADYRIVQHRLLPKWRYISSPEKCKNYLRFLVNSRRNIARFNPQRRNQQRIVKFVRANLMLPWIKKHFDVRIVFVVRHPAAVIMSQLKAARTWNAERRLKIYRADRRLLAHLDRNMRELLFAELEDVEALALSWCVENSIAMSHALELGLHVVHYERLLDDPENEWRKILTALELPSMPPDELIRRPSQQAWGPKARNADLVRQYDGWKTSVDQRTAFKIQQVLDAARIGFYRMDDADPVTASSLSSS